VRCIGNGTSGNRIQTIYAHAHDVPDRYESVVTSLREWMGQADQAVWTSAGQTGGGKRRGWSPTRNASWTWPG
jgi:hypothetical protein